MNKKRTIGFNTELSSQCSSFSPNGITFRSDRFLPEWTEMEIQMQIPSLRRKRNGLVGCRGVVIQCGKDCNEQGFEVALFFLDLPKKAADYIATGVVDQIPLTISLAH